MSHKLAKPIEDYTLREMIIEMRDEGDMFHRLPINYLTEATPVDIRNKTELPISLSGRKLGDITMKEVMSSISVRHLHNLKRISVDVIDIIATFVEDNSYPWPIKVPD